MYFVLAGVIDLFRYLHYGLSAVLGFIGLKMIGQYTLEAMGAIGKKEEFIPAWVSLVIVAAILAISILASMIAQHRQDKRGEPSGEPPSNPIA